MGACRFHMSRPTLYVSRILLLRGTHSLSSIMVLPWPLPSNRRLCLASAYYHLFTPSVNAIERVVVVMARTFLAEKHLFQPGYRDILLPFQVFSFPLRRTILE